MDDDPSLYAIVTEGDRRRSLQAIRDELALKLPASRGASAAMVAKTLAEIIRELDTLGGEREVSAVDQLAARRQKRLADAAGQ